jgi:hypothetical protein
MINRKKNGVDERRSREKGEQKKRRFSGTALH